MQLKTILLSITAAAICCNSFAQDKIYKSDGEVIDVKIKNVGTHTITYSRYDNQSGPEYTIMKMEVSKVKYQNGSEENFDNGWPPRHPFARNRGHSKDKSTDAKQAYGKNVLSLAPLQFTDNGLGFSLGYERVLDKNGIIAFTIPLIATFNLNHGTYYDNATHTDKNGHQDAMYYVMPGVRLYPGGNGRVRYGVGPSVMYAAGERSSATYDPITGATNYATKSRNQLGMMLNNSLNINPSAHIHIEFDFGVGFTYLNRIDGLNQGSAGIVQGAFKLGYRF